MQKNKTQIDRGENKKVSVGFFSSALQFFSLSPSPSVFHISSRLARSSSSSEHHLWRRPGDGGPALAADQRLAERLAERRRRRLEVGGGLPEGLRRGDLARRLDPQVDHRLGGVRDGVAAEGDVRAVFWCGGGGEGGGGVEGKREEEVERRCCRRRRRRRRRRFFLMPFFFPLNLRLCFSDLRFSLTAELKLHDTKLTFCSDGTAAHWRACGLLLQ